ncbi:hypothetical protein [Roseateles sp.]|uniref:hypothetical protein n=1 Tax=Roseateles sp. TaxID=1971397 RepID=UPI0031D12157
MRRGPAQAGVEHLDRARRRRGASIEHPLLEGEQRGLQVAVCRRDRLAQLGAIQHGEVRAIARRRHQVRRIAKQRHAGHACPAMRCRQGVDGAEHRCGLAVGDQRGERGVPAVELPGHAVERLDPRSLAVVVAGHRGLDPRHGLAQRDVGVDDAVGLAMRKDPASRRHREEGAAADRRGAGGMTGVGIGQVGFDERRSDVGRGRVGQQGADLRPGPIGADEQIRRFRLADTCTATA